MVSPNVVRSVDVLIVGAGLSGVGAACHLQRECPDRSYLILEARDAIGGTWDLFRYPGVRSDSDMFTLGYSFRPWTDTRSIADGRVIREYVRDTARDFGVTDRIRFGHRVVRAEWSSAEARWSVDVERAGHGEDGAGETVRYSCRFLYACCGYYRYDAGHTPDFAGRDDFRGTIVHPQLWPDDLDWRGKRVVVIGSGATAVSLVPAMAGTAEHVTMLQRSPSYVLAVPSVDSLAERLGRRLPQRVVYPAVRWKNILVMTALYQLSQRRPGLVRRTLRKGAVKALPAGYDIETHFAPEYDPWDQRMCFVPDGDLFAALRSGRAEVVTDRIETFTAAGIRLASGRELSADIVVTATGLSLQFLGGMTLSVDGREVRSAETVAYRAMMLSGVPNLAIALGYINASWTLKADLTSAFVCRLLEHLRRHGYDSVTPLEPDTDERTPLMPLTSGYVQRALHLIPQQGAHEPWRVAQRYAHDRRAFRRADLDDGLVYGRAHETRTAGHPVTAVAPPP